MNNDVPLSRIVLRFALVYSTVLLLSGALLIVIDPSGGSSLSIAALVIASYFAVSRFVSATGRVPTAAERNRLAVYSLVSSLAVSMILALVALVATGQLQLLAQLPSVLAQVGSGMVIGVLGSVLAIYFFVIWLSYLGFAKFRGRGLPDPAGV
jgi:hypothetical protein